MRHVRSFVILQTTRGLYFSLSHPFVNGAAHSINEVLGILMSNLDISVLSLRVIAKSLAKDIPGMILLVSREIANTLLAHGINTETGPKQEVGG